MTTPDAIHPGLRSRNPVRGLVAACAAAFCFSAPVALAADNPGAHQHGHARLQIALENRQVDVLFVSPAHNLAGFEHKARTDQQKARLAEIRHWLETNPLVNTTGDKCTLASASVLLGGAHDDDHPHGNDHHESAEHHHDDEASHRDYEVTQRLFCDDPISGQPLTSALMAEFPELQKLEIQWVTQTAQGSVEMTSASMSFSVGE